MLPVTFLTPPIESLSPSQEAALRSNIVHICGLLSSHCKFRDTPSECHNLGRLYLKELQHDGSWTDFPVAIEVLNEFLLSWPDGEQILDQVLFDSQGVHFGCILAYLSST
ncbi:uncharacterized protein MELLADRAFT_103651 [Melampsora larici-populina 98AG31]|uniref:Uncharacterized protein n=1 Tax=Melampsora larici-populina (strain 98AG31 / pathotype 3-4-7) TaxID=747676 RepID=F4RC11_MELLP|nr:uncharacterized protein MELLADRAFT_103651 [Melampsora larici-populina 98AG31]EGG10197.1 hypothetical protein MELLADRAFT_103651 [Melampsora larici-populina 98AG31]